MDVEYLQPGVEAERFPRQGNWAAARLIMAMKMLVSKGQLCSIVGAVADDVRGELEPVTITEVTGGRRGGLSGNIEDCGPQPVQCRGT